MLGEARLNIAHIAWGRDVDSGEAFTLINLDSTMSAELLETIRGHEQVLWAEVVSLPEGAGS